MNRLLTCILGTAVAWSVAAPSRAVDNFSRGLAMAQGMMNMMDGMGMFGTAAQGMQGLGNMPGQAWNQMSRGIGDKMAPVWDNLPQSAAQTASRAWEGLTRDPGGQTGGAVSGPLDGTWRSNTGERLWIDRGRFRLQSGPERSAEGLIQLRERILGLYLPEQQRSLLYEYAEYEGRLALRDDTGRLFLFRRIPAEGLQEDAGRLPR